MDNSRDIFIDINPARQNLRVFALSSSRLCQKIRTLTSLTIHGAEMDEQMWIEATVWQISRKKNLKYHLRNLQCGLARLAAPVALH